MKEKKGEAHHFVKWFSELSNKDVAIGGGKGASLAEMYNNKFPIPPGFIITAQAYQHLLEKASLHDRMNSLLNKLNVDNTSELNKISKEVRELISGAKMPEDLEEAILEAYAILDVDKQRLSGATSSALDILRKSHEPPFVAVRSSATTEDLESASFAGQQESFLNVKGNHNLIQKVKECFASLFTARAVYYRTKKGFPHDKSYLAVVVQKMINSDKSGVIFSKNPVSSNDNIVIEAVFGLGEGIVSGQIKPDHYEISSDLSDFKILETSVVNKEIAIVRDSAGNNKTVKLREEKSKQQVLSNYEIKRLAQYSKELESHYGKPQDIEFAIEMPEIYIVQSRPITTVFSKRADIDIKGELLLTGLGASPGIASGEVRIVHTMADLSKVQQGDILVTKMTNPDMVVSMQKASAIVTDEGGVTSHASIVSREMGIPAVVGTNEATKKLKDGEMVTVDGNAGKVYSGKTETKLSEVKPVVKTKTKIKVIVDLPNFAERASKSGVDGVGLVRLEGIIAGSGKHPLWFVKEKKMDDYITVLVEGLAKIVEPFKEIWIRTSDIRTDEFRNLKGAVAEVEGNPMLGDHGIRFSLKHPEIMKAELTAMKEIAEKFPHKHIGIMMPQVINVLELRKTKEIAEKVGMPKNIKIGIMVETPAAVQIINSLCEEGIKFISFGSNDLTQYTLAIDRNNSEVQYLYNEMDPAVLNSIAYVIGRCKKYGVETSICGQAGSREDMAKFLISQGIDSISVNADAAHNISQLVAKLEADIYKENEEYMKEEVDNKQNITILETSTILETKQDIIVPMQPVIMEAQNSELSNKDVEDAALEELGEDEQEQDYQPGSMDKGSNIPPLNDAIPVESEHLEENKKEEIIEFSEKKEETIDAKDTNKETSKENNQSQ
ncbi:MAG: phosphoenolpyruvate synthase [Nanoarchaeota archaeon]